MFINIAEDSFALSDDITIWEEGVKRCIKTIDNTVIVVSVAFQNLYVKKLYTQLGYTSVSAYINERLGLKPSQGSRYKLTGEMWTKYKDDFLSYDLDWNKNSSKIRYYEKAKLKWGKDKAIEIMSTTSLREFEKLLSPPKKLFNENSDIQFNPKGLFIDSTLILSKEQVLDAIKTGKSINLRFTKG